MQAAIGIAQLEKLPLFIEARRKNHKRIYEGLKEFEDLIILPKAQINSNPSWFGFLITLRDESKIERLEIVKKLEKLGIQTKLLFAGNIVRHPVFDKLKDKEKTYRIVGDLTNTDKVMNDTFWIGVYPGMTDEMTNFMIEKLSEILNQTRI